MLASCRRRVLFCSIKNPFVEMAARQVKLEMLPATKGTDKNFNDIFLVQTYIARSLLLLLE